MNRIATYSLAVGFAFTVTAQSILPALANNGTVILESSIDVSFIGVPAGTLFNTYSLSGNKYTVSGSIRSNRLVSVIARTKASYSSSGRIAGAKTIPSATRVKYKSKKKKGAISLAFASGNIKSASVSPKKKIKNGTVPLKAGHKRSVMDPVSALVFSVQDRDVGDGNKICNRTLPVFDGTTRYNLKLSYKSTQSARARGFSGDVFICSVRYQPIAGHRPHKKNVKFMKANRKMRITLARIGKTNTYGLFGFQVTTRTGTATGRASKFAIQ